MLQRVKQLASSQLSSNLFGILSIYCIYAVVYERLLMMPYYNNENQETEYQLIPAVLMLWEQVFAWVFVQILAGFKLKGAEVTYQNSRIPLKITSIFSVTKFISIVLFMQGIYQTNFRFAFMVRTGLFVASSIISALYDHISEKPTQRTKIIEILCALLVLGGTILFWIFDPQICFYVPIYPQVKAALMIVASVLLDGGMGVLRAEYLNREKVNMHRLQRDISSGVTFLSFFYLMSYGTISSDLNFPLKHLGYMLEVLCAGFLYFLAQLIQFKASTTSPSSSSGYLISSGMFLTIMISYTFSVHPYYQYQVFGVALGVLGIIGGLVVMGKKQETQNAAKGKVFKPYEKVCDLEIEDLE